MLKMNKYEPEKTELDISSTALYCGLAVVLVFAVLGGLMFFHMEVFNFIGIVIVGFCSGIASFVGFVFQVTKPLNESVGSYFCYLLLAISMWAYCVHHKIYDWFEVSKKRWLLTHQIFYILSIVAIIFVVSFHVSINSKSYDPFCLILFFFASTCFKIYVACQQSDHRPSSFEIEHIEYMKKRVRGEQ